ncbi:hypothetical protein BH24BAC1_BH24BAC1_02340 [soil metagenome]
MEAPVLYEKFENNVNTILDLLDSGLDTRSTPYQTSIPLEVNLLCEVLNRAGASFSVSQEGTAALVEFREEYMQQKPTASEAIRQVLEDKRSYMRSPGGATVLLKEMLFRRLEFFHETARSLQFMKTQQKLGSPKQFNITGLLGEKKS